MDPLTRARVLSDVMTHPTQAGRYVGYQDLGPAGAQRPLPTRAMALEDMQAAGYNAQAGRPLPTRAMPIEDMRAQGYNVQVGESMPVAKRPVGIADAAARTLPAGPGMYSRTFGNALAAATPGEIGLRQANDLIKYLTSGQNVTGNQFIAAGEDIGGSLANPNYQPRGALGQAGAAIGSGLHRAKRRMGW